MAVVAMAIGENLHLGRVLIASRCPTYTHAHAHTANHNYKGQNINCERSSKKKDDPNTKLWECGVTVRNSLTKPSEIQATTLNAAPIALVQRQETNRLGCCFSALQQLQYSVPL